jgi:hypothetical protein
MGRSGHERASRAVRTAGLGLVLLLGASAPGCLLPELVIDGSNGGSGGAGSDLDEDGSGGNSPADGVGGGASGGVASTGGSGGSAGAGGSDSGAGGSGGGSGGDDSGGSGGAPPVPGYYQSHLWHGFVSSEVEYGTLSSPDVAEALSAPYCVSGTLEPREDYLGFARFVWNLDQPASCTGDGCIPAISTVTPSEEGIVLRLDNPGGTSLRVQIQAPGVDDSGNTWCTELGAVSGLVFVPWADFSASCWLPEAGVGYANEPIERLAVVVAGPGGAEPDRPFDFCVELVGESNSAHQNCLVDDAPGLGSYSLTGAESADVVRNAVPYVVRGNLWGDGASQVIEGTGTSFEIVASGQAGVFPGVFVGDGAGLDTGSNWLPRDPFAFASTIVIFRWNGTLPTGGVALVEMLFSTSGTATDPPSHSVQLWLDAEGRSPGGTKVGSYLGSVNRTWEVFSVVMDGVPTAVFVSPSPMPEYLDSPMPFITHAIYEDVITAGAVLTSVSGGFQLPSGGGAGLEVEDFCANSTVD